MHKRKKIQNDIITAYFVLDLFYKNEKKKKPVHF